MKHYRFYNEARAIDLMKKIIKTEQLTVSVKYMTTALGDDVVDIYGEKEEVKDFEQIFEMVYR